MPEQFNDTESFGGLTGGAEQVKETQEKFQEKQQKSQSQQQQDQKQEGKKKQDDNALASVIVQFLNEPKNTSLFLLISRLIAKNIPSNIILAH